MTISVGILGYGAKARFVRLLAQLENHPSVLEILLFWNGAPQDAAQLAETLGRQHGKLRLRMTHENLGSAGGYSMLLQWFEKEGTGDLLWLLDDDSIPESGCIDTLFAETRMRGFDPTHTLLMAYRADLPEFPALLEPGTRADEPRPGVCVGMHLLNLLGPVRARAITTMGGIFLSAAPYGGLLIPRQSLRLLGLPDEKLFLYGDDTVLTLRFTRAGGKIKLCPDAVVRDSEPVWNAIGGKMGNMVRRIAHLDDRKAYYEARNRCYLGSVFYPGNPFVYWVNRTAFLASALLLAIRHNRLQRFRLLHRALQNGERMAREHVAREARNG